MHNYHLVELHQSLRNGLEEANCLMSVAAGYEVNPMEGVIRRLDATFLRYCKTQAIRSFYFDGPETATLMRRFRLAGDLHALYPDDYPPPPTLEVPPLPRDPMSKAALVELIALNAERLPIAFSYTSPAYQVDVRCGRVEHFSRCCLFGETIELPGEDVPLALTYNQVEHWLMSHTGCGLIKDPNYWSGNDARYTRFMKLVRGLRITMGELGLNQGIPTYLDKILITGRGGGLRGTYADVWSNIRYRLSVEHPELIGMWTPIVDPE